MGTSGINKLSEAAYFLEVTRIYDIYKILKLGYSIFLDPAKHGNEIGYPRT